MINPSWPFIVAIAFFVAVAYAVLVARLNNHVRYGEFWRQHEWVEVVIGSLLVAVTGCSSQERAPIGAPIVPTGRR